MFSSFYFQTYCPKAYQSREPVLDLVKSYSELINIAIKKGYKNIVSVSLGTGAHGYKHEDIAGAVLGYLNDDYIKSKDVNFTLVLPNEEIKKIYTEHK